ncbi:MAG: hypothetical protein ACHQ50_09090, partial [Fimbriimonadales bacterium]
MADPILPTDEIPLSFVACVSNGAVLQANLLASPCLGPNSPHEVILVKNCSCAADGLNIGLERAKNEQIVCVHQDVYLPEGWDRRLARQIREAERRFGPIGVAGVYGVGLPRDGLRQEGGQAPRCATEPVPDWARGLR